MFNKIKDKQTYLSVIGLGYVGLPIALAFAKKVKVLGFDINSDRVHMMQNHIDPSNELSPEDFQGCDITFTSDPEDLKLASFYIVAVPTPIDSHNMPDLKPLLKATDTLSKVLKKGDYVVYESTVYPGCTEDDCVPILEKNSGLRYREDFKVGFSPERINPGDKTHTLSKITKVVSGCDMVSAEHIAQIYEMVVDAGVYRASSIKVAEAAKIIENTQRDLNIALMNELSIICDKLEINTFEVLEAAGTKWNFLKFYPGLVGGHCIGVDPYYLTFKAIKLGHHPEVILSGRKINDSMGNYIATKTVQLLIKAGKNVLNCKVLMMGATFKENVSDIRNSKAIDIIKMLNSFSIQVDVVDPCAKPHEFAEEYGLELLEKVKDNYDAIIVAVSHNQYINLKEGYFKSIGTENAILIDIKGLYRNQIDQMVYWSL
ncbi:MAG: nucleotide sugar dehydrogenase [Bacteroidota bacterium]